MNNDDIRMPIEQMYVHRRDFIVVALTGITGSGCSDLANIMSNDFSDSKELCNIYFDDKFKKFCEKFYNELKRRDYFAKNLFVHRLANSIRATGTPYAIVDQDNEYNCDHIFDVIDLINGIIKGYHENYPQKPRRFVIDSVRSSLEIMYMRERYSGFYSVALHNDGNERKLVEAKVLESMFNKKECDLSEDQKSFYHATVNRIMALSNAESDKCDFEKGLFYSPDISRCVTESEIHLSYNSDEEDNNSFKSLAEQWMKFYSLIVRPGLITPSSDERCMSIAYVAKFNSGCISRKVGCTIVDKEYTVQSIGWNDPPSTQLPCQMRYADELYSDNNNEAFKEVKDKIYSKYELTGNIKNTGKTFVSCLRENVNKQTVDGLSLLGLRYSYCFRSQYNKFTETKDQVNTRSLHAEENTMLRLAKSGGNGLKDGIMYVTASPCVLCSKKAFQIGIREIVYLDPYTDIAPDLILRCGWNTPKLKAFKGAIGVTFYKLYRPFMPYKDEIAIFDRSFQEPLTDEQKNIQAEIQEHKNKIKELNERLETLRKSK